MNQQHHKVIGRLCGTLAVLGRNLRVWRRFFLASAIGDLAEPILYLVGLGYGLGGLVTDVHGMSYVRFIAPGLVVTATLYSASFEATYGTFTRMVPQKTFEGVLGTPIGVGEILMGEILYATIKAFVAGCAVLLVVTALGLVDAQTAAWVPVLCMVSGLVFSAMAVLMTCLSPSYDFFNYYFTLVVTPMVLFSGIFFPLDQLPTWAQSMALVSPLTHAASISHALFNGVMSRDLWIHGVFLIGAAIVPIYPAMLTMRTRLIK